MKKTKSISLIRKILIFLLVGVLLLSGCGSEEAMEMSKAEPAMEMTTDASGESEQAVAFNSSNGDMDDIALEDSPVSTSPQSDSALATQMDNRKYIRTFRYYMETLTFDETVSELDKLVDLHFGFYQSSETSGRAINSSNYQRRQGSYVIRIPKEKVDEFTKGIEGIGHILDKNNFVDDVTGDYFDLEARIKTLRVQEERLLAILEEANELEYIIELERELSNVTYEIERYMTSFKELENQINYSTIYVDLTEVFEETVIEYEPPTFFEKMQDGFMDSVNVVIDFFEGLILFLTTNIPVFILLGVIGFIIYKIVKKITVPKKFKKQPSKTHEVKVDISTEEEKEE